MKDDQLDDLKQFIEVTVSQSEQRVKTEISELREEMNDGFAGVGEAIEEIHKIIEDNKTEVDQRLNKLEQQKV